MKKEFIVTGLEFIACLCMLYIKPAGVSMCKLGYI